MMTRPEAPRARNAATTRAKILSEAQIAFARVGYPRTGIRDIAAAAAVNSALLRHYFGSKAGLFEAALTDSIHMGGLKDIPKAGFGVHLVEGVTGVGRAREAFSMIAHAIGDPVSAEIATRITETAIITPLADWLGSSDARDRAVKITMMVYGFAVYTRQMPLIDLDSDDRNDMKHWIAACVQRFVDEAMIDPEP